MGGVYPGPSQLTKGQDSTTISSNATGGDFGDDAQAKLHNTMAGAMLERAEINPEIAYTIAVKSAGGQQRAGISNFVTGKNDPAIPIKTANAQGFMLAEEGDGIDISSRMETHRGTVQKQMAHTLDTSCSSGGGGS